MASYYRLGGEFGVNRSTAFDQTAPSIATFADGSFVIVWGTNDAAQDGDSSAIKGQLFDSAGNKVGAEFLVNSSHAGSQFTASVAALSDGSFVVTWVTTDSTQDGTGNAIKAQLYAHIGNPIGGEFLVNAGATFGSQTTPNVAALTFGGFVVSWDDTTGYDTKAQIFSAGGGRQGDVFTLNTNTAYAQEFGDITALAGGGFVATWRTTDPGADGDDQSVKAQIFDEHGGPVGGEFLVNTKAVGAQYDPAITALSNGGFVVTWMTQDTAQDGSSSALKAQLFSATGAKVGSEFLVNTQTVDMQREAAVTSLPDGGFLVVWSTLDPLQDGSGSAIKAQAFDAMGAKVGTEFRVNTLTSGSQFLPDVATLADGRVVIAWASSSGDGSGHAVRAQFLSPNQAPVITSGGGGADTALSVTENKTAVTTVAATDDGHGAAVRYSLAGGADAALFKIDAVTGALSFLSAPNFEAPADSGRDNVYDVVVRASDGELFDDQHLAVSVTNVNEGLSIQSKPTQPMVENQVLVTYIGAVDQDGDPVTYSIVGGADGALFTIDRFMGGLKFVTAPDFEAPGDANHDNSYEVLVRATDGQFVDDKLITVTVSNVNEGLAIISPAAVSVAENGSAVATVVAHDIDGDAPRYSIVGGADAAAFAIDPQTGALTFVGAPDFEAPRDAGGDNVYDVVVRATDGQFVDDQHLAVTITNVNEGIAITSPASVSVAENGTAAGTVTAFDPDGTPSAYSIVGGADAASFAIDPATGALSFVSAPDFEAHADANGDNVYEVIVRASDGEFSDDQHVAVTVTNVNEGIWISSPASLSVLEGDTAAGTVSASDPDGTPSTYSIAGGADAALFTIDAATGTLSFVAAPDFEAPADADGDNGYEVIVRASDGELFDDRALTVSVCNVNEPLSITSAPAVSIAENATFVTNVAAIDSDHDAPVYSIAGGADAGLFAIDAATGALSFRSAPDFEAPADAGHDNVYDVIVRASDGQFSDDQHVSVTVGNVNEGIAITSSASFSALENGIAAGNVAAFDPDGTPSTYSIAGGADAALFVIDAATGALSFRSAPDYEAPRDSNGDNVYQVLVEASDGEVSARQLVSVTVGNVDEGVTIAAPAALSVRENDTAATNVVGVDTDGGSVTYAIAGGADAALFSIDAATGALRFVSAPDFERPADAGRDNVYNVTVSTTDGSFTASQAIAVTVANVDEPVAFGSASKSFSIAENGAGVGSIVAVDPDGGHVVYAIAGGADAALFTIDAATGALSFRSAPDYEAPRDSDHDNVYSLTVSASDGTTGATQAVSVSVANVDEAVRLVSYGGSASVALSVPENGRAVGTVLAADPEGDRVSYTIGGGADAAWFAVDAATGALSFVTPPNYEAKADAGHDNVYDVTVVASTATSSASQAFAVTVSNIDEPVAITSFGGGDVAALSIAENSRVVGTVSAVDPDGGAVTYSIAGGADAARFTIDAKTGVLQFVTAPDYEAPNDAGGDHVYDVTVKASDGTTSDVQAISVTVLNVQDGVTIMGSNGSDAINGTSANPALRTTSAEDTVSGGDGNDTIQGLGGDDILNGDAGKDVLTGGAGADRLTGGAGADQFVYTAVSESTPTVRDVITDFSHSQGDKIVLSGIDANSLVAGDQAFTFIGSAAFSHAAGQLRFESDGHGNTILSGDVNGDGIADFQVQLVGTIPLVSSDFLL